MSRRNMLWQDLYVRGTFHPDTRLPMDWYNPPVGWDFPPISLPPADVIAAAMQLPTRLVADWWPGAARAMVLGDIAEPWVWAYYGHVLPNGTVFNRASVPVWCSNCLSWHGI